MEVVLPDFSEASNSAIGPLQGNWTTDPDADNPRRGLGRRLGGALEFGQPSAAAMGVIEKQYVLYKVLSDSACHPSVTALKRHVNFTPGAEASTVEMELAVGSKTEIETAQTHAQRLGQPNLVRSSHGRRTRPDVALPAGQGRWDASGAMAGARRAKWQHRPLRHARTMPLPGSAACARGALTARLDLGLCDTEHAPVERAHHRLRPQAELCEPREEFVQGLGAAIEGTGLVQFSPEFHLSRRGILPDGMDRCAALRAPRANERLAASSSTTTPSSAPSAPGPRPQEQPLRRLGGRRRALGR